MARSSAQNTSVPHRKEWLRRKANTLALPRLATLLLLAFLTFLQVVAAHEALDARGPAMLAGTHSVLKIDERALSIPASSLQARATSNTSLPMPTAFDGDLGNNFTSSTCLPWLQTMLAGVAPCAPVSLMLQTSISFFDATKSLVTITRVLSNSCSVSRDTCSSIMAGYAAGILAQDVCGPDYALGNPIVSEAYVGLLAYDPIYAATCLTDNSTTGNYCYASAVTNASSPSASYIYYLPLGVTLPAGLNPSCNGCLQDTLEGFSTYAANATQPLSRTYPYAAGAIDLFCGPTFVNQHVIVTGAATKIARGNALLAMVAALILGILMI